ncbi:MAG TPA: NDP-sugar synthase [Vicinamibacterales bacterium]|nr:NDP-sugar synthase [Vicinamibacterales bacterium]
MSDVLPFRRALVLTAGFGTRLRPLTCVRAKAAVPVDGEPLVRRVIRWLVAAGVDDLVLNLHHKPETIAAVVGDGADLGARVRYSWEQPVLGSAGGPRRALPLLTGDDGARPFLIVNGDTLTDVDLRALGEAHAQSGALVTMALIPNPRPDKYGGVALDGDGRVTGFTRRGSPEPSRHFIGVQAVQAEAFADLPDGVVMESVLGVYPRLMLEQPGSIRGFLTRAAFQDIGTPADLWRTSMDLAAEAGRPGRPAAGARVAIAPDARVERSVLWDDVSVAAGARVVEAIVADGVSIPPGAVFERCAIVRAGAGPAGPGETIRDGLRVAPLDRS